MLDLDFSKELIEALTATKAPNATNIEFEKYFEEYEKYLMPLSAQHLYCLEHKLNIIHESILDHIQTLKPHSEEAFEMQADLWLVDSFCNTVVEIRASILLESLRTQANTKEEKCDFFSNDADYRFICFKDWTYTVIVSVADSNFLDEEYDELPELNTSSPYEGLLTEEVKESFKGRANMQLIINLNKH